MESSTGAAAKKKNEITSKNGVKHNTINIQSKRHLSTWRQVTVHYEHFEKELSCICK